MSVGLLLLLLVGASDADPYFVGVEGDYELRRIPGKVCVLKGRHNNPTTIEIARPSDTNLVVLGLNNPAWASLQEGQKVPLEYVSGLRKKSVLAEARVASTPMLSFSMDESDFNKDLAKGEIVIKKAAEVLFAFSMTWQEAFALHACADGNRDPFAKP
ncbi:hypothetical protein [Sphingobium xenophagum]|uniref:hypothetical protein n=1 Tax=Sphingobium xenophagum TaxID=121428 RepID=UPI000360E714|nr:hypothetical protein [Sphingobium xenophagum]